MKTHIMKMTVIAAGIAGVMASMGVANASTGNAASLMLEAQVTKTTCQINTGSIGGQTTVDFGSYVQDSIFAFTEAAPDAGMPVNISFSGCTGDDIAVAGVVKLEATGVTGQGSNGHAFGTGTMNAGIGFNIKADWTNSSDSSTPATTGVFTPLNNAIEIYGNNGAAPVGAADLVLPEVQLTPQLYSFAAAATDIPVQSLQVPVTLSVSYN